MKIQNLLLSILVISLSSCRFDKSDLFQKQPEVYHEIVLDLGGEINVEESPLSRSQSNDLYGIQVNQSKNKNDWTKYAYIIYDDPNQELKVNLLEGYYYRFQAIYLKDGKSILLGSSDNSYSRPFNIDANGKVNGSCTGGKFLVSLQKDGSYLGLYNIFNSELIKDDKSSVCRRPINVFRYNGSFTTEKLTPESEKHFTINMWRRYFAVLYSAQGLQSGYKLKISLDDSPVVELTDSKTISDTIYYSLSSNTLGTYIDNSDGKVNTVSDNARLLVTVSPIDNESKKDTIYYYNMSFKRNYLHKLRIDDIDHIGTSTGLKLNIEEEELAGDEDYKDLPWQSGKL